MELSQSTYQRMDQRQLLTPRMIQSMEILQLPLAVLEERIEQELQSNPVLELRDSETDAEDRELPAEDVHEQEPMPERTGEGDEMLVLKENDDANDFDRLEKISEYLDNEDPTNGNLNYRAASSYDGERDKKLDALNNTASRVTNITEHLMEQWALSKPPEPIEKAGEIIISSINQDGYLLTELEKLQQEATKYPVKLEDLQEVLRLVQTMEPAGVGARNLRECLLLQLDQIEEDDEEEGHDFELERKLVSDHLQRSGDESLSPDQQKARPADRGVQSRGETALADCTPIPASRSASTKPRRYPRRDHLSR